VGHEAVGVRASGDVSVVRRFVDPLVWGLTAVVLAVLTLSGVVPTAVGVSLLAGSVVAVACRSALRGARETPVVDARALALAVTGDGAWDYDLRTSTIAYDERCARMLGYGPGEVESHIAAWGKLVHPDDLETARTALDAFIAGQADAYEVEVRLEAADGSWRRVLDRAHIVERDADGQPTRLVGVHRLLSDASPSLAVEPPRIVEPEPDADPSSVLTLIERAVASRRQPRPRVEVRSGDFLGNAGGDPEAVKAALESLLDAVTEFVPVGTLVPVRPRASRNLQMLGFSLGLPAGATINAASPHLEAARAKLQACRGRLRVHADQIVVELAAAPPSSRRRWAR